MAFCCEVAQKRFKLLLTHVARMPQLVKMDKLAHPEHISFLSTQAVMKLRNLLA